MFKDLFGTTIEDKSQSYAFGVGLIMAVSLLMAFFFEGAWIILALSFVLLILVAIRQTELEDKVTKVVSKIEGEK
jgi:hypothetical protein